MTTRVRRATTLLSRSFTSWCYPSHDTTNDRRTGRTLAVSDVDTVLWNTTDHGTPSAVARLGEDPVQTLVAAFGDRLATLEGHTGEIPSAAFGGDGRTLATGSLDGTVRVWDIADRARPLPVATVDARSPRGPAVLLSPDGRTMATTSVRSPDGGATTLWDLAALNALRADPARQACHLTGRGLDADEWARHIPELGYRSTC